MKITRQTSTADYKLWNSENLPETPFVLILPSGGSNEGTDKEYLVIPQTESRKGRYHLVNLATATRFDIDFSSLANKMNSTGALSVEAVISGRTSFFAGGKKNRATVSGDYLKDNDINIIKTNADGYCLCRQREGNTNIKETLYDIIPLDGGAPWMTSVATINVEVKKGTHELMEDVEINISNVKVLPQPH